MNFDFYDLLSKVIPGSVLCIALISCDIINPNENIPDLMYLFIFYILGFFIDALATIPFIKNILIWSFGGLPAKTILSGKKFNGFSYNFLDKLKERSDNDWNQDNLSNTFDIIYRKVFMQNKRIQDFNNDSLNSRNIFVSLFISFLSAFIFLWVLENELSLNNKLPITILLFVCMILSYCRTKSRQCLFIKEVLDTFLFNENK